MWANGTVVCVGGSAPTKAYIFLVCDFRYVHADMIGVPVCVTVDAQTGVDGTVTLRDRDSMDQHRVRLDTVVAHMQSLLSSS